MTFDTKEFVAEVDAALDAAEKQDELLLNAEGEANSEEANGAQERSTSGEEADENRLEDASIENSAKADGNSKEERGTGTFENDAVNDDGSPEETGDQEGSGAAGEGTESKEVVPLTISDYAVEQAVRAGFSIADAKSFGSEEALLRVANIAQQAAAGVEGVGTTKEGDDGETESLDDLISKIPDLDPEEFQPETVAMFDALKGIIKQQQDSIREIHEQQAVAENARYETSAREVEVWFDSEVESLGKDFAEALGEGGYGSLPRGSSQLAKRDQIAEQMSVMLAGYAASEIKPPARSEVFKTAARNVLHGEFDELRNKNVAGKLAKRSTQHTQRVAGKKTKSHLSPEEETAQLLDQKYK